MSDFDGFMLEINASCDRIMTKKNGSYSKGDEDKLHNFKVGAAINGSTPAQACWGYMTKHLVALRDKVQLNDFSDRADLLEKCTDIINYVRFIWLLGNEELGEHCDAEKIVEEV